MADGLTDAITIPLKAKTVKQRSLVKEIIKSDRNADEWL